MVSCLLVWRRGRSERACGTRKRGRDGVTTETVSPERPELIAPARAGVNIFRDRFSSPAAGQNHSTVYVVRVRNVSPRLPRPRTARRALFGFKVQFEFSRFLQKAAFDEF